MALPPPLPPLDTSDPARIQRLTVRALADFVVEDFAILRAFPGGNFWRTLIVFTIAHAEVEHLLRDAGVARRDLSAPPPSEARRPVKIATLASRLAMSLETTRRHVAVLISEGVCLRVSTGVSLADGFDEWAAVIAADDRLLNAVETMVARLAELGFPFPLPGPTPPDPVADGFHGAPRLAAVKILHRMLLDLIESARAYGDVMEMVIFNGVMSANARLISDDIDLSLRYAAADAPPPKRLRRSVSVRQLAETLELPYETVRRKVNDLEHRGLCSRQDGGVIVTVEMMQRPDMLMQGLATHNIFMRSMDRLSNIGVRFDAMRRRDEDTALRGAAA